MNKSIYFLILLISGSSSLTVKDFCKSVQQFENEYKTDMPEGFETLFSNAKYLDRSTFGQAYEIILRDTPFVVKKIKKTVLEDYDEILILKKNKRTSRRG